MTFDKSEIAPPFKLNFGTIQMWFKDDYPNPFQYIFAVPQMPIWRSLLTSLTMQ
jgi:hypothetical protein